MRRHTVCVSVLGEIASFRRKSRRFFISSRLCGSKNQVQSPVSIIPNQQQVPYWSTSTVTTSYELVIQIKIVELFTRANITVVTNVERGDQHSATDNRLFLRLFSFFLGFCPTVCFIIDHSQTFGIIRIKCEFLFHTDE